MVDCDVINQKNLISHEDVGRELEGDHIIVFSVQTFEKNRVNS